MSKRNKRSFNRAGQGTRSYNINGNLKENIVDINSYRQPKKIKVDLLPKNLAQERYLDALEDQNVDIVFATGPAGTGKTMLAALQGIKQLNEGTIEKIVITRPAISVDEQHGFLPGTLIEKMQPWVLPILDYFYQYYNKKQVLSMIEDDIIEIAPLAYMRGRTFKNCWILADECQNSTPSQMKMLLTRIGDGSKIIVTGDMAQHDRGYEQNGLKDILYRYRKDPRISVCHFNDGDIERHPVIERILEFYSE